ncbi:hypothetical protein [Spiroplasma endosymbiont of Panorpa germanica]|uniref:hypothetical protein n=1 Tax=Spiroplasma endosymbiont of Panorpa germanica TaxID=3066314 RepID=UPI0030CE53DA
MKTWEVFQINYSYEVKIDKISKKVPIRTFFIPLGLDYDRTGNVIGFVSIQRSAFEDRKIEIDFYNRISKTENHITLRKNNFASVKLDNLKNPLGVIDDKTKLDVLEALSIKRIFLQSIYLDGETKETLTKIREKFDPVIILNNEIELSLEIISKNSDQVEELIQKIEELDYLSSLLLEDNQKFAKQTDSEFNDVRRARVGSNVIEIKNHLSKIRDNEIQITNNYKFLKEYNSQLLDLFSQALNLRDQNCNFFESVIEKFKQMKRSIDYLDRNHELPYLSYCLNIDPSLLEEPNFDKLKFDLEMEKQSADSFRKWIQEKKYADENYDQLINRRDDLVEYDKLFNKLIK